MGPWYHSQRKNNFLRDCTYTSEIQLGQDATTKLKKKYPYFSLSILYLYQTANSPPETESFNKSNVFVPNTPGNWEWDIARV